MGIFTIGGAGLLGLGLLKKAGYAAFITSIVNSLTGNPIGGLVDKLAGKRTTKATKDNLNLNNRLVNLNRGETDGVPTQGGALRFLGDRSNKLDDAPDIVPTNQSVLNDIAKNQGLSLGTTVPPEIDDKKIIVDGFAGMVGIIDQINKNIAAIGNSLVETSSIEGAYRKELLDDLEKSIAKKGKTRSRTRFEKAIFNFVSTRKKKIKNVAGNVSNDLSNALLMSVGMELAGNFMNNESDSDIEEEPEILFGDDLVDKYGRSDDFNPEDVENNDPVVNDASTPENNLKGIVDDISIIGDDVYNQDIDKGVVVDSERLTEKQKFEQRQQLIKEKKKQLDLSSNIISSPDLISSNIFINPENSMMSPLDSISGATQIIDLRTAEEIANNDTDSSSASSQLDTAFLDLDPSRRISPYEGFARSV